MLASAGRLGADDRAGLQWALLRCDWLLGVVWVWCYIDALMPRVNGSGVVVYAAVRVYV